jgi:hypothetical protein
MMPKNCSPTFFEARMRVSMCQQQGRYQYRACRPLFVSNVQVGFALFLTHACNRGWMRLIADCSLWQAVLIKDTDELGHAQQGIVQ